MFKENKILIIGALITAVVLIGGVFFFSKKQASPTSQNKVQDSILIASDSHITGGVKDGKHLPKNENPKIVLVEFGDYQCPACSAYSPLVTKLLEDFEGKINFVYRNYPLPQHSNAIASASSAEAADTQGKFWEMHDKLYATQKDWTGLKNPQSMFDGYAKDLGLNIDKFNLDTESSVVSDRIKKDQADGNLVNINATPTFFLNGSKIANLPGSYEDFKKIIEGAINNSTAPESSSAQAYHIHFDLKVYLNGKALNLSLAKYQESDTNKLDPDIHLHDANGKVVHVHKENVPLSRLFDSFKLTFPEGTTAFVNGKKIEDFLNYVPQDLDQILIGNGPLSSVSKDACIYSLKCPERGTPPPEDCVGGLGTGCTE